MVVCRPLHVTISSFGRGRVSLRPHSVISSSVDSEELTRFGNLSGTWSDEQGPFKALHSLNKLRVPWIMKNLRKDQLKSFSILDVGSGGGLLSVPLARNGLSVTGIDATPEAVAAAQSTLGSPSLCKSGVSKNVSYELTTAEEFAEKNGERFDAVVASEIIEHVADVSSFVSACVRLARPGAPLFFTTINRTLASRVAAIWLAENVLRIVPEGVHDWNKFVTPEELTQLLHDNGCRVRAVNGFTYHPIGNHWEWISNTFINYALLAEKIK